MRTYTIKKIEHHVYEDLSELPSDLVYLKDWRKAEIGDWVLADDGCIIQILRKNEMRTKYCCFFWYLHRYFPGELYDGHREKEKYILFLWL